LGSSIFKYLPGQLPRKCKLPPKRGSCGKTLERVYYDPNKRTCLNFIYGGCGGNKNNFATLKQCLHKCKKFDLALPMANITGNIDWKKFTSKKCKLPPQKGWCRNKVIRFYYDSILHRCREFFYRGCGGNGNRFTTYYECVKECDVFGYLPV
ncbi:papilin-like, partial [Crotalus tigris]|uniref:papilin-like n=1 Tax=Crotalus tigris TaxID=88082 RepID=UPI00192F48E4